MVEYDDNLLEPVKHYKNTLKERVNAAAEAHFEKLVQKAGINIEENRETVKKYDEASVRLKQEQKKLSKLKVGKGFAIFGCILFLIMAIGFIYYGVSYDELAIGISVGVVSALIGIGFILLICLLINKKIKAQKAVVAQFEKETNDLLQTAYFQMGNLHELYDYGTAYEIFDEAVDIINFDKFFDKAKLRYLIEKCDYQVDEAENHSTLYVKSGEILGNPFILRRTKIQTMYDHAYHGSRTVTYTESYRDSNGNYRTRTVTETLHATIYKPAPRYGNYTELVYGNQAAPNLSFSRTPTGVKTNMSDKERDKFLRKKATEYQKMSEKALKNGGHFTPLANTEFEAYFGALDRDNEPQFRLLFTPLAQKNIINHIKSDEGYGDDYNFYKIRRSNYISSGHVQSINLTIEPSMFYTYSYDIAKDKFTSYINSFFKCLYFDFVPLLSIPLYQQLKTVEYIYKDAIPSNNTMYEAETISNRFDESLFLHPESRSEAILKSSWLYSAGESDKVNIRAHSFRGEDRIDYVPVRAGNGLYYDVPVPWIEYIPVSMDSQINVRKLDTTRPDYLSKVTNSGTSFSQYASNSLGEHKYFDKLFAYFGKGDGNLNESTDNEFTNMYNN